MSGQGAYYYLWPLSFASKNADARRAHIFRLPMRASMPIAFSESDVSANTLRLGHYLRACRAALATDARFASIFFRHAF